MKNNILKLVFFAVLFLFAFDLFAQCPMCRMTAESNLKAGGSAGKGLNAGILYMLLTPYIAVAVVAFIWWRNRKTDTVVASNSELNFSDN